MNEKAVRKELKKMVKEGLLEQLPNGSYKFTEKGRSMFGVTIPDVGEPE